MIFLSTVVIPTEQSDEESHSPKFTMRILTILEITKHG